nr:5'-methylthioadenosine/S-adenosylhomocysteine nucleosidase [Eubacterium sp.]
MKKILIQGAMFSEISYYLDQECFQDVEEVVINGFPFYRGKVDDKIIIVQLTKMGTINATMATMTALYEFQPDVVINQGTAGAQVRELTSGDIVIGKQAVNVHSLEMPARGYGEGIEPKEWVKMHTEYINAEEELVQFFERGFRKSDEVGNVISGTLGTGDLFSKEKDRILWLRATFGHLSEDMETFAVYQACRECGVPCVGIRVISNNELLGEPFDSATALTLQKMIWNVVTA